MSPTRRSDPDLDNLIAEITIDCHDEDEALTGFENAFDEAACLPCPAVVVGEHVELLFVAAPNGRRELTATCQRAGRRHQIALLDIQIPADQAASRLQAAYQRWLGADAETT
jgi:hypothetical protein